MIIDAHAHVWPDSIAPRILATRPSASIRATTARSTA